MGLFGYNEKDFAKSTADYKARLEQMMYKTGNQLGIGKLLNTILVTLDNTPYPNKAKSKDIESIDKRIGELLNTMLRDIQDGKPAKLSEHAKMLLSAVVDSRQYGSERYTPEELKAQHQMAECQGTIYDILDNKGKIAAQKEELIKRASKLSGPTQKAEQSKLGMQFNALDRQEKEYDKQATLLQNRYNSLVDIVNARQTSGVINVVKTDLAVNVQDYAKMREQEALEIEKITMQDEEISSITVESDSSAASAFGTISTSNAFDSLVESQRASDIQNSVDGASVSGVTESADPFLSALNDYNK